MCRLVHDSGTLNWQTNSYGVSPPFLTVGVEEEDVVIEELLPSDGKHKFP